MTFKAGVVHKHKPTGRPRGCKGIAKLIAKECGESGEELVQFLLKVLREDEYFHNRKWACETLLDRFAGKPMQSIDLQQYLEMDVGPKADDERMRAVVEGMSLAELRVLDTALTALVGDAKPQLGSVIDVPHEELSDDERAADELDADR